MKKQFQSKSVPRGTRTLWRYLGALFILFTFAIGNVWAAEIFSTDVLASVSSATVSQDKGAYTTGTATSWSDPYENYFATSGSAGYYQLAFSTPISLTGYTDVKVNVYWGTTSNRPLNMTINGGSATKIDEVTASADRSKLRVAEGAVSVSSISSLKLSSSGGGGVHLFRIEIVGTPSGGGGGSDPVDPTFTYTTATYTIGDPALDLSTKLSSNSSGAITFAVSTSDAGTTGASIASDKNFTATTAGTATITVSQAASTGYNAHSEDITVTVVEPDPCTTYFHFVATADATANGKTNWDGFTNAPTGSNGQSNSVTIDGSNYTLTKRTGSTGGGGTILGFTIPANKAGTLYGYMKSSGSAARTLSLKKGDDVVKTNTEITDGNWTLITISAIAPGTYTLSPDQNVQIQMFALKVCDATFHTITLDLDGGTGATSIQALDGVPATKPADPTKDNADFVKWVVKSTGADYNWSANVTGDLTLKAIWAAWPTLTLAAGEGATGDPIATQYKAGTEISVPEKPEGFSKGTDVFMGWAYSQEVTVADGKFDMPSTNLTLTAQWAVASNFDVKFYQGYGEPDTQIGETQSIATGAYATAPATDPTREGFNFKGWSYDATEEHIVNVAEYAITAATNFTAIWKQVFAVTFDGASSVNVESGSKVASPDSPSQEGKVFLGWYNGESKYDFSAAVTADLALESKWAVANPNHFYYTYNDDFHFDGVVYKTPEGKVDNKDGVSNKAITTPYTLFSGVEGITSIVATGAIYDSKSNWVNAYLKLNTGEGSYLTFTIKSGYTAVLKMKMGGYSANPTVTLKKGDDVVAVKSGTIGGVASTENNFNEITYDLAAGTYTMTTATKTLYISHIDLEATELPKYSVTYNAGTGAVKDGESMPTQADAYEGQVITLASGDALEKAGHIFAGWVATYNDGEEKTLTITDGKITMPAYAVTVTAQWEDVSNVCKIGDVKYESLETALEHAADGTIELLQDIDVTAQVEVLSGVTATIDLAGHKIEYTGASVLTSGVLLVHNGASLTINDSSDPDAGSIVAGEKAYAALMLTKVGDNPANPATLVINGGTFTGLYYAISGNGSRPNTNITINGGTFTATAENDNLAIYHPQNGTLTINGGSFEGYLSAIEMRAGTLVINNGTFTATATEFSCNPNGSGTTTVGAAIAIAQHTTKTDIVVTIKGGTFEGEKAINESNPQENDPAPQVTMAVTGGDFTGAITTTDVHEFISGGTFDAPVANENCAPGFVPAPADPVTGKYSVEPKDGVSIIKVATTGGTNKTVTGLYAGDGDVNLSSNTKMDNGKYIGFTLDGTTLQAGDRINVHTTEAANTGGSHIIFYDNMTDKNELYETGEIGGTGDNIFEINAAMIGATTAYVYRSNADAAHQWNGKVDFIEVLRPMKPMLTAITIDGRDGVIDEANKTVAVQIPYEADLAALTVVPTIVWNEAAASNSIVVNDGSAWTLGENTYKLTDKDGDYTIYTITLTRDVLKHTVSFNTHGGSAVASVEVVDGQKLAAAPADPTKEDYIFQYWSEDEDGAEVDVTTVQINADKEFHAVWAADGAIKLLSGATVNHTNFITGVTADETVEFQGNTVNYAKFSGTVSGVNGVKDLTRVIAYNATTNKTKIQISAHNNSTSGRNILVKGLVEGAAEAVDLATIALGNKEDKVSDWIEFNNAANRTIYIMVSSSAGDVYFTQVKVIESGETPMKQAGEAGYSLNLNKGRFFGTASTDLAFEGLNARLSGDYTALNSGYAKLNSTSMSFTVASAMTLSVTTNNNKTYYVTKGAAGTDNETAKTGVSEFDLTAGTWYITAGAAEVQFTNIAFALPKCEKPVIETQPATNHTFDPGDMTATVVAAEPTEGTLSYQWYNASDDSEVDGATDATLTTTTEGTYYVIVTNSLAGHQDNSTKSDEAELGYRVTDDATLSALSASEGTLDPEFDPAEENYTVNLAKGTTTVPTLSATATMHPYATVVINDAVEFVNYEATSTVVVTSEDGTATKTYTVHYVVAHPVAALVDVTENTTWDWSLVTQDANGAAIGSDGPTVNTEDGLVIANYLIGDNFDKIEGNNGAYSIRSSSRKVYQGASLHMHTTKGGVLKITAAHEGTTQTLNIQNAGRDFKLADLTSSQVEYTVYVKAGDVIIYNVPTTAGKPMRVSKMVFTVKETPDYYRDVTNNIGTLCVDHNVLAGGALGATFYQIASRNEQYNDKIDFEEVLPNEELKAGEPYIFQSTTGRIDLFYGETVAAEPVVVRGMHGVLAAGSLEINEANKMDVYYIEANKLRDCSNLSSLSLVVNRAYIVMSEVPTYANYQEAQQEPQQQNSAPRRRVTLGRNGEQIVTGLDAINASEKPMKIMIDGQIYILRGEKVFDATGRLVK